MKISLILMAVLFAVVPVLGLSAPLASADEVFPPELSGDTLYLNPNLSILSSVTLPSGSPLYHFLGYTSSSGFSFGVYCRFFHDDSYVTIDSFYLTTEFGGAGDPPVTPSILLVYRGFDSIDDVPSGIFNESLLSTLNSLSAGTFIILNSSVPFPSDWTLSTYSIDLISNVFSSPDFLLSFTPFSPPQADDSFVNVWGETAEFVGDIFIQVGDLFYDDTAEELTPIGTMAVIMAGIAVVLLVWNLIRSFLPMRG